MQTAIPTIIAFGGDNDDDDGVDDEDDDGGEEVGDVAVNQVHADGHPNKYCLL